MAEFSLAYVLSTPGGTITFNTGSDTYYLQNVTGLDGAPIRAPIDNRPQAHGGLVHRALLGPRHITFDGMLLVTSAGDEAGYVVARQTLARNLQNALLSLLGADGTLSWTPSGEGAKSLIVRHDQPLAITGTWLKSFVFGLVAAQPTY